MALRQKSQEGWGWLSNNPRRHYFVDGKSLCQRWPARNGIVLKDKYHSSPQNCKDCKRLREKRLHDIKREESQLEIDQLRMSSREIKIRNTIAEAQDIKKRVDEIINTLFDLLPNKSESKPTGCAYSFRAGKQISYLKNKG